MDHLVQWSNFENIALHLRLYTWKLNANKLPRASISLQFLMYVLRLRRDVLNNDFYCLFGIELWFMASDFDFKANSLVMMMFSIDFPRNRSRTIFPINSRCKKFLVRMNFIVVEYVFKIDWFKPTILYTTRFALNEFLSFKKTINFV